MYGQFHNEQMLKATKVQTAKKSNMLKNDNKTFITLISLIFITLSISTTSFEGPSRSRLPGGNGDANGR